jgi:hypothetical protein
VGLEVLPMSGEGFAFACWYRLTYGSRRSEGLPFTPASAWLDWLENYR